MAALGFIDGAGETGAWTTGEGAGVSGISGDGDGDDADADAA